MTVIVIVFMWYMTDMWYQVMLYNSLWQCDQDIMLNPNSNNNLKKSKNEKKRKIK